MAHTLADAALRINLDTVDGDIDRLADHIPFLIRPIHTDEDADHAQDVLVSIGRRRSILAQRYTAVLGVHERLKSYQDSVKNWLYRKAEIQGCRNEAARNACTAQVLAPLTKVLSALARQLKQMETVQWALRSNQECVQAQIRVWTTQTHDS
jgi:hypothetical protein